MRALVESGRFSINAYLAYGPDLARRPLEAMSDPAGMAVNTGDLSLYGGWFYPNKPPGVTLLAAPGYALMRRVTAVLGIPPDGPRAIEVLGWLTSVFSVGLLGAASGVVFLRLGRRLFPSIGTAFLLGATLAMALGTPFLPYATMLFDHVPVAALLLFAFERLVTARDEGATPGRLTAAGAAAALAVVCNYAAVLGALLLGAYAVATSRPLSRVTWALVAGVPFLAFLLAYHAACFGGPFTIANTWQAGLFQDPSGARFLSVFAIPDPRIALALLVSPYRGLLLAAPVLLFGFAGALLGLRHGRRLEIATGLAIFLAYLAMNSSFNAWHGGFAYGPRYLVPTIPFIALGLVPAFARWPRTTGAAAALSIALCLVATAIDPMPPQDLAHPWPDFLVPLARGERLERPEGNYQGPVSANLVGMGAPHEDRWNAFNVGEVVFPESGWSLAPLLVLQGVGWVLVFRAARPAS